MALINRVTQLFRADAHAMLDYLEEPEQLLRQAVRDMQDECALTEQRAARLGEEAESLEKRRDELTGRAAEIDAELDLCFAKNKHDLARGLVRRKLEAERLAKRLSGKLDASREALASAAADLEERRRALESMRQKAAVFSTPARERSTHDDAEFIVRELDVSEEDVDVALLREQEKRGVA